jgi:hypothetical protein
MTSEEQMREECAVRKLLYKYLYEKYVEKDALAYTHIPRSKHRYYLRKYIRDNVRPLHPEVTVGRCEELAREILPGVLEERREKMALLDEQKVEEFNRTQPMAKPIRETGGCLTVERNEYTDKDYRRIAAETGSDVDFQSTSSKEDD